MRSPRALDGLELKEPAVPLVPRYLAFLDEVEALGERVWPARPGPSETLEAFVARLLAPPVDPTRVPQTTYWAILGDDVVGQIDLRHRLNTELAEYGGHIGYTVRASHRGRGVATEMLRRIVRTPKAREI